MSGLQNLAVKTVFHIHDNWYCGQNKEYWPGCLFIYIKDQKQIGALYLASRLLVSKNRLHEMKSHYNSQLPQESLWTICKNKRYKVFDDSVLYTSGIWLFVTNLFLVNKVNGSCSVTLWVEKSSNSCLLILKGYSISLL